MQHPSLNILRSVGLFVVAVFNGLGTFIALIIAGIKLIKASKSNVAEIKKKTSEADLNEAQSVLTIAKAHSVGYNDELRGIQILHKFINDQLILQGLLERKNELIADQEDQIFALKETIKQKDNELEAYERQKMEVRGTKLIEQSQEKTGTDAS
jgi:hypothetical protein